MTFLESWGLFGAVVIWTCTLVYMIIVMIDD